MAIVVQTPCNDTRERIASRLLYCDLRFCGHANARAVGIADVANRTGITVIAARTDLAHHVRAVVRCIRHTIAVGIQGHPVPREVDVIGILIVVIADDVQGA